MHTYIHIYVCICKYPIKFCEECLADRHAKTSINEKGLKTNEKRFTVFLKS